MVEPLGEQWEMTRKREQYDSWTNEIDALDLEKKKKKKKKNKITLF
jgi:hypothetical protein